MLGLTFPCLKAGRRKAQAGIVFAFRFCQFPQEIVLQMVERCRIRKLQLLAHQYMISSKVEFYISESLPEYLVPYQAERFRRLG